MHNWNIKGEQQKIEAATTLKCSWIQIITPRKLKKFTQCWSYEINMIWTCRLFMPNCFDLEHFKVLGILFFCLFTLYSHYGLLYISLSILHWPFKNLIKEYHLGILPKFQANQTVFGNSPCLRHFSDCLLILFTIHTIWKLSWHSGNFPDNMESVHKIRKIYRQPRNFLDNQ